MSTLRHHFNREETINYECERAYTNRFDNSGFRSGTRYSWRLPSPANAVGLEHFSLDRCPCDRPGPLGEIARGKRHLNGIGWLRLRSCAPRPSAGTTLRLSVF